MMQFEEIIYSSEGGIAQITLNRPNALNALSPTMVAELKKAVKHVSEDESIKVLIVTGNGRAFSAGVDLNALNQSIHAGQFDADQILLDGKEFIDTIQLMPQVTIAMVNGFCFTGAMEFMLAFDLIYAADDAKIGDTHAKWGIQPKWGMTQRLPLLVGILKAKELSFTAQPITGEEAEKIGLVNKSFPADLLASKVWEVATQITKNSAQGIAAMKSLYLQGMLTTLQEGLQIEYNAKFEITDREQFLKDFRNNKGK